MIIIEFKEGQGLGNQLWYYSSAKSIADKLNFVSDSISPL